jgi:hypothetical protein
VGGNALDRALEAVLRHRLEHLLEHDPSLEPGEGRAEAVVDALAEGEVALGRACDVELVRAIPTALVAVGGPQSRATRSPAAIAWPWSSVATVAVRTW